MIGMVGTSGTLAPKDAIERIENQSVSTESQWRVYQDHNMENEVPVNLMADMIRRQHLQTLAVTRVLRDLLNRFTSLATLFVVILSLIALTFIIMNQSKPGESHGPMKYSPYCLIQCENLLRSMDLPLGDQNRH